MQSIEEVLMQSFAQFTDNCLVALSAVIPAAIVIFTAIVVIKAVIWVVQHIVGYVSWSGPSGGDWHDPYEGMY